MINVVTTKGTFDDNNNDEIKGKVIRSARLARQILERGKKSVWLFDVKPDRDNRDRSCFIFEDTPQFQEIFGEVLEENRRNRDPQISSASKQRLDDLSKQVEELKKMLAEKE